MSRIQQTALVIGASSGIGAACVGELVARGWRVAAVARRAEDLERICAEANAQGPGEASAHPGDVTAYADVKEQAEDAIAALGGELGLVIYAAGAMPRITPETWDTEQDLRVLETNLLGFVAWMNALAPRLQAQGRGSIVGISSIAGDRGRRGFPAYCTSKAAMDTYLEALRNRLHRHGVRVTTIKPGYIATAMTEGMEKLFWVKTPAFAAREIVQAALKGKHTRYVPGRWALVGLVVRNIPSFLFRKLDI